jgi:hypothetical protein
MDTIDLVRRFNEDEAVWQCFIAKRSTREPLGPHTIESIQDDLDWIEAEREFRQTRCIGWKL